MIRQQVIKVEFFLLRVLQFRLDMPPAEGRFFLDLYMKRLETIFQKGRFKVLVTRKERIVLGGDWPCEDEEVEENQLEGGRKNFRRVLRIGFYESPSGDTTAGSTGVAPRPAKLTNLNPN